MDSYPYLGVKICLDVRWDRHVTVISTKATRALNAVRWNIYRCTPEAKELAYTSFVCPLMEFAALAWDPYRVKDINKLEMVQCHAVCFAKSDYHHKLHYLNSWMIWVGEPFQIEEKELV